MYIDVCIISPIFIIWHSTSKIPIDNLWYLSCLIKYFVERNLLINKVSIIMYYFMQTYSVVPVYIAFSI